MSSNPYEVSNTPSLPDSDMEKTRAAFDAWIEASREVSRPRCRSCRFFNEIHESISHGTCQRRCPSLGNWPVVDKADWCGEWELDVLRLKNKEGGKG